MPDNSDVAAPPGHYGTPQWLQADCLRLIAIMTRLTDQQLALLQPQTIQAASEAVREMLVEARYIAKGGRR